MDYIFIVAVFLPQYWTVRFFFAHLQSLAFFQFLITPHFCQLFDLIFEHIKSCWCNWWLMIVFVSCACNNGFWFCCRQQIMSGRLYTLNYYFGTSSVDCVVQTQMLIDMTFLVGIITRRCMMCSSSGFPCHWCVVTHKCASQAKGCGAETWMVAHLFFLFITWSFVFNTQHFILWPNGQIWLLQKIPKKIFVWF